MRSSRNVQYLDVDLLSPIGLRIVWTRLSAKLFCWLADHAPRLAEVWAFHRWLGAPDHRD